MKKILTIVLSFTAIICFGQTAIDIAENTLKIAPSSEEAFYFGFAEGDQLIFNFEEINGKELKELEISMLASSSIFMDYKTKKIENKTITIAQTGIYKFRFANANIISGRVCKFKIQRIPESDKTKKFNTTVFKRRVFDTTYYNDPERYVVKSDTIVTEVISQTAKVHSELNHNGNRTTTNFVLPPNTVAWSYYIGVNQAGQDAYKTATKQLVSNSTPLVSKLIGGSPLTALALGAASYLSQIQGGQAVDYYLVEGQNANLFSNSQPFSYYKKGNVINDFAKMEPINGSLFFCLFNSNRFTGIDVLIKVTAVQVNTIWDTRYIKKMSINSNEEMYLKN